MTGRRAVITEAEIRRAVRAAKAEGFDRVEVIQSPDGLRVILERTARAEPTEFVREFEV